jgi:hypothetical protein
MDLSEIQLTPANGALAAAACFIVGVVCQQLPKAARLRAAIFAAADRQERSQATIDLMGTALGAEAVEWERISLAAAAAQLQSGDMKAESLLLRLLRRAVRITAATNCVTEFPHELGTLQKVAKQLDGEVGGPLRNTPLPLSLSLLPGFWRRRRRIRECCTACRSRSKNAVASLDMMLPSVPPSE